MTERGPAAESVASPVPPAAASSGDAARELGENVGRLAALTLRRFRSLAVAGLATARAPTASGASEPAGSPESGPASAPTPAATARAEEIISRAAAQFSAVAATGADRLNRAAALAREEAEDIWVDAEELRRRSSRTDASDMP
ncbi:MAG: hypothetical protein WKF55_03905 [Gemmatimonadaceae bacterium]